jgi:hypothetical protein
MLVEEETGITLVLGVIPIGMPDLSGSTPGYSRADYFCSTRQPWTSIGLPG